MFTQGLSFEKSELNKAGMTTLNALNMSDL